MKDIKVYGPTTVKEASSLLDEMGGCSRLLAGGTDLLGVLKEKILPVDLTEIISLKDIDELKELAEDESFYYIGAANSLSALEKDERIKTHIPLLSQAAKTVASPQIRHMATIGGNICQEPRCWYYRYQGNKFNCLRKGGDRCNAVVGNNLYHSIFGPSKVRDTPCETHCPNHTNIPGYMELIRNGKVLEAAKLLFHVNPLAAVTGRICPHTCEQHCNRSKYDESVAIREVERYLGDFILDHPEQFVSMPSAETGKRITIIGAGPAGLTAAFFLRGQGHKVTVLDKNAEIGGMLFYGIPAYRLPKEILAKIRSMLESIGVEFSFNIVVGEDIAFEEIMRTSDAMFVGIGAWISLDLNFEGKDAKGILNALDFLYKAANKIEQKIGKRIVVIGGGNTSFDVCRSALKMGAEKVTLLSILPFDEMPAEEEEISEAKKEGVEIKELTTLKTVVKKADGAIEKLVLQKMKKADEDAEGIGNIMEQTGDTEEFDADNVIIAIGQGIDTRGFDQITDDNRSITLRDDEAGKTALANIFAAGDGAYGPATVVKSIFQARNAAESMNDAFAARKHTNLNEQKLAIRFSEKALENTGRVKPAEIPVNERALYVEIVKTIDESGFSKEAERCLNCGCVAVSPSDVGTALVALDAVLVTNFREIPVTEFFDTPVMASTVLEQGELVKTIKIPKRALGNEQTYHKHRVRKSIDFPIVSIALNGDMDGRVVNDIRIVFGAVAPTPRKMREVEAYLKGKELTKEVIKTAAELAVKDCMALAENKYKINLLKVLFRRNLETMGQ